MNDHQPIKPAPSAWRGTGFAYCPAPDRRVRRAVRKANGLDYPAPLAIFVAFAVAGAVMVFGGAALAMLGVHV
jgi:hypothetical protein